jgi:hypothetical protein
MTCRRTHGRPNPKNKRAHILVLSCRVEVPAAHLVVQFRVHMIHTVRYCMPLIPQPLPLFPCQKGLRRVMKPIGGMPKKLGAQRSCWEARNEVLISRFKPLRTMRMRTFIMSRSLEAYDAITSKAWCCNGKGPPLTSMYMY